MLFVEHIVQARKTENAEAPLHWPFVMGIHRWAVTLQRDSNAESVLMPWRRLKQHYCQTSDLRRTKSQNVNDLTLVLQLSAPYPLKSDVESRIRCRWSSAGRRCSNYIKVIKMLYPTKVRLISKVWRYMISVDFNSLQCFFTALIQLGTIWANSTTTPIVL